MICFFNFYTLSYCCFRDTYIQTIALNLILYCTVQLIARASLRMVVVRSNTKIILNESTPARLTPHSHTLAQPSVWFDLPGSRAPPLDSAYGLTLLFFFLQFSMAGYIIVETVTKVMVYFFEVYLPWGPLA